MNTELDEWFRGDTEGVSLLAFALESGFWDQLNEWAIKHDIAHINPTSYEDVMRAVCEISPRACVLFVACRIADMCVGGSDNDAVARASLREFFTYLSPYGARLPLVYLENAADKYNRACIESNARPDRHSTLAIKKAMDTRLEPYKKLASVREHVLLHYNLPVNEYSCVIDRAIRNKAANWLFEWRDMRNN